MLSQHQELTDKASLCIGVISDYDPATGYVKVSFDEDDDDDDVNGVTILVTDWIPLLTRRSQNDKEIFPMDIGEQVACIYNWDIEQGVCLGALFNDSDAPDGGGNDIYNILFKDGSSEKFDRSSGDRTLFYKGTYKVSTDGGGEIDVSDKLVIKNSSEDLKTLMTDIVNACIAQTYTNGGGVTVGPNNTPTFTNFLTRINNLFT